MTTNTFIFIVIFLIGLYYYSTACANIGKEGMDINSMNNQNNNKNVNCPNILVQKDSKFYLYNTKLAKIPGVNPVEFENLEDYTEFLDWQRSQNIRCPVLYLQNSYDTQGNSVYTVRPSVTNPQGGLNPINSMPPSIASSEGDPIMISSLGLEGALAHPNPSLLVDASRDDPPFNKNSYPGYDESSYYVGKTTPLDAMNMKQEALPVSPDAMDPNWGGAKYTQNLVNKGYYSGNEVKIKVDS